MKRIILLLLIPSAALLLLLLRFGQTWQLLPMELIIVFLAWQAWRNPRLKYAFWVYVFSIFGIALSALALYLMPLFQLPRPAGSYAIGVRYITLSTDRPESFTKDTTDRRVLFCKVWYPANTASGQRNPYLEGGKRGIRTLAQLADLPAFLFTHFLNIKTHSFTDSPIAEGAFPMLTFSHGYGSWFGQNTALMEELASRGFVVLSIGHSHQTIFAAQDAQNLVTFEQVVPLDSTEDNEAESAQFDRFLATADTAKFKQLFYEQLQGSAASVHTYAGIWAEDICSGIDYLLSENQGEKSFWFNHIDTSRIGAFGMSFGGAAAGEAALRDTRIRAGINMDGTAYGTWQQDTMRVPFLLLEAKRSPHGYSMYAPLRQRSTSNYANLLFVNAEHYNFTDVNLFSPLFRWMGVLGSINGKAMIRHLNSIVPDFFIKTLSGKPVLEQDYVIPGQVEQAAF